MALADTAKLAVQLSLTGNFARQLGTASKSLDRFGAKVDYTQSRAYRAGQQIGTGIQRGAALAAVGVGLIAANVVQGLDSLVELEKQTKQTEAAIKSTGGVAGVTAGEIRAMAEEFEGLNATIGDEVIQNTENLLLSFTNIRKKAFKPALQAILDINTRLGRGPDGLAGTARQVGKALQDPTKGLAALTRLGITFDAKTTKRIKTLQKQGKLFEAQGVILKELKKRFGGAFGAEGGTTAGKVAKFKDAIEDLQRTLAAGLLPVVSNIADALTSLFQDPAVQKGVADFGKQLASFLSPENIKSGIGAIKDIFSTIAAVAGPAAAAVGAMVSAFSKLPPDLRNLLVGAFTVNKLTGGLVTNIAGGLIGALKNLVVPVMNVQAANVSVVGGGPGGGVPGAVGGAAGVGTGLAVGTIVAAVAATVASTIPFAERNNTLAGKGLNAAEIAALKYYQASTTEQQTIAKRLGYLPSKADFDSAQAKLRADLTARDKSRHLGIAGDLATIQARAAHANPKELAALNEAARALKQGLRMLPKPMTGTDAHPGKVADDLAVPVSKTTSAVVSLRDSVVPKVGETTTAVQTVKDSIDTRVAAAQGATELASRMNSTSHTRTQGTIRTSSYNNASIISNATRSSAGAIVAAIWAARPIVNVTNVTRSTTIQQRYGPGNGSSGTDNGFSTSTGH